MYGFLKKPENAPDHPYWTANGYQKLEENYAQIEQAFNLISELSRITELQPEQLPTIFRDFQQQEGYLETQVTLADVWHYTLWMADMHLHDTTSEIPTTPKDIERLHMLANLIHMGTNE